MIEKWSSRLALNEPQQASVECMQRVCSRYRKSHFNRSHQLIIIFSLKLNVKSALWKMSSRHWASEHCCETVQWQNRTLLTPAQLIIRRRNQRLVISARKNTSKVEALISFFLRWLALVISAPPVDVYDSRKYPWPSPSKSQLSHSALFTRLMGNFCFRMLGLLFDSLIQHHFVARGPSSHHVSTPSSLVSPLQLFSNWTSNATSNNASSLFQSRASRDCDFH